MVVIGGKVFCLVNGLKAELVVCVGEGIGIVFLTSGKRLETSSSSIDLFPMRGLIHIR